VWRRLALAGLVCAVLAWQAWALLVGEFGMPESRESGDTYWVEVSGGTEVSQTVSVDALTFSRFVLVGKPQGQTAHPVHVTVEGIRTGIKLSLSLTMSTADAGRDGRLELSFPPIRPAAYSNWLYRFTVKVPAARPGSGLALLANRHDSYPDGALFVDGREQWGDLVFRTGSSRARVLGNVKALLQGAPAIARSDWVLGPVLVAYAVALVLFFWGLLGGVTGADRAPLAAPADTDTH
jgi:hypothetical protein